MAWVPCQKCAAGKLLVVFAWNGGKTKISPKQVCARWKVQNGKRSIRGRGSHFYFSRRKQFFFLFARRVSAENFKKSFETSLQIGKKKKSKNSPKKMKEKKKREKKMSCHKSRRKLVMWFEWLEAPERSSLPATIQTTTFPPGLYRTPSRNKDTVKRKRNIIYIRLVVVRVVESTPAHLYTQYTRLYDISGPVLLPGILTCRLDAFFFSILILCAKVR